MMSRSAIVDALVRELVGPDPFGDPLVGVPSPNTPYTHLVDSSVQEVLRHERPLKRYGAGVLVPIGGEAIAEAQADADDAIEDDGVPAVPGQGDAVVQPDGPAAQVVADAGEAEGDDEDDIRPALVKERRFGQSSAGLTFRVSPHQGGILRLRVIISGAWYERRPTIVDAAERIWWFRHPLRVVLDNHDPKVTDKVFLNSGHGLPAHLGLEVHFRVRDCPAGFLGDLVTVTLINRSAVDPTTPVDSFALFQTSFSIEPGDNSPILPYPNRHLENLSDEEQEIELMYRKRHVFAIGHGIAANWILSEGDCNRAASVNTEVIARYEAPSISADLFDAQGLPLAVGMLDLAAQNLSHHQYPQFLEKSTKPLLDAYQAWISSREAELTDPNVVPPEYHAAAKRNIAACSVALHRMQAGVQFLRGDPLAAAAFRIANLAMAHQRARAGLGSRAWVGQVLTPQSAFDNDQLASGKWRPFQIAFLLMAVASTACKDHAEREVVDLIWFPTGGGKTEAYLGLVAFTCALRRLRAIQSNAPGEDTGVEVIMRYTLRLLSAQQFERAASLFCAIEYIRRHPPAWLTAQPIRPLFPQGTPQPLGTVRFVIGLFSGTTPNDRASAIQLFNQHGGDSGKTIKVLARCPWCHAPTLYRQGNQQHLPGYSVENVRVLGPAANSLVVRCPDIRCAFSAKLPVVFVDQDMLDGGCTPPTMLIGTVDKFANLAWKDGTRRLFGRNAQGQRQCSPPNLVLQDELHLVSGPLGSVVGLFETVIEALCTDAAGCRPKIVASTATIRGYREHALALFARSDTRVFPPSGLDADESFFASIARDPQGKPLPGRLYLGVLAPGLGSLLTTQVRTVAALQQAAADVDPAHRDPWWTLLAFYNSIRELGGALTLTQSDLPDYRSGPLARRRERPFAQMRTSGQVRELSGRTPAGDVFAMLDRLAVPKAFPDDATAPQPLDICLASNIIEVGVDIDRLSLMAIVGQPKSTAQYIQVSGRVGRQWWNRPGMVTTLFSVGKPRDLSHYERFRAYHERLYAGVEPTSLTPFAPPTLERVLHMVLISWVRQTSNSPTSPASLQAAWTEASNLVRVRMQRCGDANTTHLEARLTVLAQEATDWNKAIWVGVPPANAPIDGLFVPAGPIYAPDIANSVWQVMQSLRTVDAETFLQHIQ